MDLALRMVRDVFAEDFTRLVTDDRHLHEKIVSFLKKTSPELVRRVDRHKEKVGLFDYYSLQSALDAAMKRKVWLPSGGHIAIDRTEALCAIDVNTGRYVGKRSLEETIVKTNLEACAEVVRQIRLRDLGGILVIDFIDMEDAGNRDAVFERFNRELERDRAKNRVLDISPLGLVEMTRKNVSDGPFQILTDVCPTCGGEGRVLSDQSKRIMVHRRMRSILRTGKAEAYLFGLHPDTYELVMEPGQNIVAAMQAETGKPVTLVPDDNADPVEVRVLMEGKAAALKRRG
jgi:ribonuclease G